MSNSENFPQSGQDGQNTAGPSGSYDYSQQGSYPQGSHPQGDHQQAIPAGQGHPAYGQNPASEYPAPQHFDSQYPASQGSLYGQPPHIHQQGYPSYGSVPSPYVEYQNQAKGLSIASMILGIASLVGMGFFFIPQIVGIVLGHLGLAREPYGKGMAIAGLIMNYLALVGFIIMWVFLFFLGAAASNPSTTDPSTVPSFGPSTTSTSSESFT